jgi:aldehyde dehydrogenase
MTIASREFTYAAPGASGSPVPLKERYDNFIGGRWVAPVKGHYAVNLTPVTGRSFTEVPVSTP